MAVQITKEAYSRLNVRLKRKSKERIAKAAHILGQDLTEFTESVLSERAIEVIERYEALELSEAERQFFFDYMDGKITVEQSDRARRSADDYLKGRKVGDVYEFAD